MPAPLELGPLAHLVLVGYLPTSRHSSQKDGAQNNENLVTCLQEAYCRMARPVSLPAMRGRSCPRPTGLRPAFPVGKCISSSSAWPHPGGSHPLVPGLGCPGASCEASGLLSSFSQWVLSEPPSLGGEPPSAGRR